MEIYVFHINKAQLAFVLYFQYMCLLIEDCGEGDSIPLQYSCLENPMDRGASWATVHRVAKSWTRLSDITLTLMY